ncbi:MAG: hypothetical protein HC843_14035, partial [Sphingomonadales bacterium]|nr:hypothetical protein [Sphingomonadales bacterium]
ETVTLTAGDNIQAAQIGNEVQFALNPVLTNITSIAVTGGPNITGGGITLAADDTLDVAGTTIVNVGAGSTAAGSSDGINGGQINTALSSVASNLGGGSVFDPVTGTVTAPVYTVAGGTQGDVGTALDALDTASQAGDSNINSFLGGGGSLNPDGSIAAAPAFAVNGSNYTTVADALAAAGAGFDLTTGAVGTGTANGTTVEGIGAGETVTLAAGDNLVVDQAGNDVTYSLASDLTGLNSVTATTINGTDVNATNVNTDTLNITGGLVIDAAGIDMAGQGITGMANGNVAAGSTDAVTGDQLFTATQAAGAATDNLGQSVADNLGGSAVYNPATNTVDGLSIAVAGGNETTVTDAIEALDTASQAGDTGLADALGGGASVAPDGTVTAPTYNVAGATQNNVGDALTALDDKAMAIGMGLSDALGGGAAMAPDGTITAPTYTVDGSNYNNVGDAIDALAADSGYIDFNSTLADASATGNNASAIGPNAQAAGNNASTFGANSNAGGNNSLALGSGASANDTNSVALGANSIAGSANAGWTGTTIAGQTFSNNVTGNGVVSVSGGSTNRQITGVADGAVNAASTDAVNGSQLFTTATALDDKSTNIGDGLASSLGGGASVAADGTITAPVITVGGTAYNNVTDAIEAGDVKADEGLQDVANALGGGASYDPATGAITAPAYTIAGSTYNNAGSAFDAVNTELTNLTNGTSGLVQQVGGAPGTGDITVGAATGGTVVDVTGTDGERTLTGLLDGNLSAGSTDAVNGSQINTALSSVASNLGGGSVFDPVTGTVTAPTIIVAGNSYNNVTDAVQAADTARQTGDSGLADALGGGASVAPDGTVTNPTYVVQGNSSDNVGDAINNIDGDLTNLGNQITSLNNGTTGIVQQTGGAPGNGEITVGAGTGGTSINVAGTDGDRVVTGVADGAVNAASTDAVNGSQLFAVQTVADGALQRSGGTMTGDLSLGGNRITDVAAPLAGTDAVNRDYVDGVAASQAATTTNIGETVADALGGGSTYNPVTGGVSAPTYNVGGRGYSNVGDALGASNMLAVQYVPDANGLPTNAVRLGAMAGAPPVSVTNVANGNIATGSTDAVNGGQLYDVSVVANGALQRTGGTLSGNLNLGGNRITGLANPVDASDAATRGYVDALQLQNLNNFNLLTTGLNNAFKGIERNSQGVALAIAMGGGFLSDDKDFSLWGAWGNFAGYNAAALQTYIRLSDDTYINAGLSYGFEEQLIGTRVGFGIQF